MSLNKLKIGTLLVVLAHSLVTFYFSTTTLLHNEKSHYLHFFNSSQLKKTVY